MMEPGCITAAAEVCFDCAKAYPTRWFGVITPLRLN
jgi:hypothetical protein